MNVLLINYEFPPLGGGAANASYHIAKEMTKTGNSIIVLSSHFKELPYKETLENGRLTILRIPVHRKQIEASSIKELLIFSIKSLFHTPKIAKQFNIDYSLAFFTIPSGIPALLLKYLYKIPYIISLRGADVPGFVERDITFYHHILKPLTKLIWKKSSKIIANSKGLEKLAMKTFPNTRYFDTIPNGIDCNFYTPKEKINNTTKKKIKLLYVGRFSKQKGLDSFIPLIQSLKTKNLNFNLCMTGDGPNKANFVNKIKTEGLEKSVSFTGWLSKENLKKQYKQADIFVFPSLCEGLPNVVLEAMASGLAIIASDIIGNNEIVLDGINGFLFPVGNTDFAANKIVEIAQNHNTLTKMQKQSREIIVKNYSWEKSTKAYIDLLK